MADAIVKLASSPRREVSVGLSNRFIEFGFTVLPPVYDALVGVLMRHIGLTRRTTPPGTGNVFTPGKRVEGGRGRWTRAQLGAAAAGVVAAGALIARRATRS